MRADADKLNDAERPAVDPARRSPYEPPTLTTWGTVRQLTRGALGGTEDFPPTFDGTQDI